MFCCVGLCYLIANKYNGSYSKKHFGTPKCTVFIKCATLPYILLKGPLTDLTAVNLQSLEDLFETIQASLAHSKKGVVSLDLAEVGGPVAFCSI